MAHVLVVLGMHRSGTSALVEALVNAGAWFGPVDAAIPANEENPRGFFERADVRKVTDEALDALGCSWHDLHGFKPQWEASAAERLRAAFHDVIEDLAAHPVSVVKDPRLCLLMPLFAQVLPRPVAVFVTREPSEVAMSMRQRNRFPATLSFALWELYTRHALAALNEMPWVHVRYEELVSQPAETLGKLLGDLKTLGVDGLRIDQSVPAATIEPGLRRQHADLSDTRRLANGEQLVLWRRVNEPEFDVSGFRVPKLSRGAREVLAWHHAVASATASFPYLSRIHFPKSSALD